MTEHNWVAETRAVEIRAIPGSEGTFEGRACVYGVVDSYGTTFEPGCFTRGGLDTSGAYALLWMHDPTRPVGTFTASERQDGLYITGQWDNSTAGQEARAAAMSGSAADLSVGFTWLNDGTDAIAEAKLLEVSQITSRFGAVPGSVLTAVRAAGIAEELRAGRILSTENEQALRDAHAAIGGVLAKMEGRADETETETRDIEQGTVEAEEAETRTCDCGCGACSADLDTEADDEPAERILAPEHIALIARAHLA